MARHRADKARRQTAPANARALHGKAKPATAGGTLQERLAAAERERDALRAELERVEARARLLEETQAKARDRIAWALDTLHNILQGKA